MTVSDNETKAILRSYEGIRLLEQQNQGLTRALIYGCQSASGDFIARIDVGDRMMPGRLQSQAKILTQQSDVVLVCSNIEQYTLEGDLLWRENFSRETLKLGLRDPLAIGARTPFHASVMMRKSAYQQVGGYRSEFYFAQDLDLFSRLAEIGELSVQPEIYTRGLFLPDGISARNSAHQQALRRIVAKMIVSRGDAKVQESLLNEAAEVRPESVDDSGEGKFSANYFIGKCLYERKSARSRSYLGRAVQERPFSLKAWWFWLLSLRFSKAV